tara:strand:+ start:20938 stop:22206 length:1269 start_codon:yes stop_codon:yes gene_type:complete
LRKRLRLISGLLTAILGIFVLLFIQKSQNEQDTTHQAVVEILDSIPETTIQFGIEVDSFEVIHKTIQRNEFLANILLPYQIDYVTIDLLSKKSKEIFDVRKMAAGKDYTILASKDSIGKAQYFIYQPNAIEYVVYDLRDSVRIYKGEKEVSIVEKSIAGIINSSLYQTLQEADANPYLAVELSEIFAWSIDFYRIQKGDWFKAIYEEKYVDGEAIGIGKILAVEFNHFDRSYLGFYFNQEGAEDYFDEEANSLRKAFLKSPLKFSRLSSRYTMKRFHPVQKRWKAHLGTDYAAPTGTPIMSTGDGIVIEASYTGGNGNYVKVKHNSAYTTQYLHMSKRNAKVGQRVRQGETIGYVGSTGLATGPHVCYRFWKYGKQVDHLKEDFPSAEPIQKKHLPEFKEWMSEMQTRLTAVKIEGLLLAEK